MNIKSEIETIREALIEAIAKAEENGKDARKLNKAYDAINAALLALS